MSAWSGRHAASPLRPAGSRIPCADDLLWHTLRLQQQVQDLRQRIQASAQATAAETAV